MEGADNPILTRQQAHSEVKVEFEKGRSIAKYISSILNLFYTYPLLAIFTLLLLSIFSGHAY